MNKANNQRRRDTIEKIEKAFISLIHENDLNQISISQLCKKAGINRTTFYSCYDGLYDVADSIRNKLESNMSELYKEEIETK